MKLLAALLLATSLQTQTIPEDRKPWVEALHKLEASPLDDDAIHDARYAVAQISVDHDFHVPLCADFYNDFTESKYYYHAQIRFLYMLGGAAYQLETGKTDSPGTNLYALHSVLKGYAAILKDHPTEKDKTLDNLAKEDAKGKLPDLIARKTCKVDKP